MSLAASIAPHLPYLRRFARALTGSQPSGDAYAVATLEAITEDANPPSDLAPRLYLFKTFLTIWTSVPKNFTAVEEDGGGGMQAADRALETVTPLPRVVFLLRVVENFSTAEVAVLLDVTPAEVDTLLDRASREIAGQLSTDVLIIEDEPIIAMDLEAMVNDLGHNVTRIARTHKEALVAIAQRVPGLVLADIHLADGSSGLDAVNDILATCTVPVVFITAYPERLLTGERPEPTFLITKPFRTETVKAIISQALFFDRRATLVRTIETSS
jgi:DNA-directed RNA polymerase specialized sigma24 family protein/CheY-like chemotaxis protein